MREAVEQVLGARDRGTTVTAVTAAWAMDRGRPITVESQALPPGVFGQWLALPDQDLIQVHTDLLVGDRTIAHELGHIVLGHRGQPISDYAAIHLRTVPQSLVAYILQRSCADTHGGQWPDDEIAAERFATVLLRRLKSDRHSSRFRLNEALG